MADERNVKVIEKIITQTKEHKISWDYLDTKPEIYQGMDWVRTKTQLDAFLGTKEKEYCDFNRENSFYARVNDTYIVVKSKNNNPSDLYFIPYTFKKVVKMGAGEYGEYITRLLNLIHSQFPDAKDFINDFLSDEE